MGKQVDVRAVEGILYGIYKALHNVLGESSAALMRKAAPDIFNMLEKFGVEFSCIDDVDKLTAKLSETMEKTGMCDKITFTQNGNVLSADISNCSFFNLTNQLMKEGLSPFCPFAALTIAIAERNLKKKARLKTLEPGSEGNTHLEVELS